METILLTGATGFLGSHLLESFVSQGYRVVILKRTTSDLWRIETLMNKVEFYNIDQADLNTIFTEVKPEIIVHTACSYGRNNETLIDIVKSNLIFGLNLLEIALKNNVKTFINTDSLLPRYTNDYSLSKAQFTEWLKNRSDKLQIVNFKIEHMYGPKDDTKKFLPWLINEMLTGTEKINLTSGLQKRDFIFISDVVEAYNLILRKRNNLPLWNEFDLGTNVFTEVKGFVLTIAKELEKANENKIISRLNFGVIPYRENDIMIPVLDNRSLLELGWSFKVPYYNGIRECINDL